MSAYYEYQLFFSIPKSDAPVRPQLPCLPAGVQARMANLARRTTGNGNDSLSMGHSRTELESLIKWFREDLASISTESVQVFDPQLGRQLFFHRDGDAQDFIDSVCKHDAWVLNHVGGDSLHVEPLDTGMPVRTRMLLIFAGLLLALYLLTNFMLDLYFR